MNLLYKLCSQVALYSKLGRLKLWQTVLLILLMSWLFYRAVLLYIIIFPNRSHNIMIPALQEMQTYCVGRYQIDLPKGSRPFRMESHLGGEMNVEFFTDYPVSHKEFLGQVEKKWGELKDRPNRFDDESLPVSEPSQRIDLMQDAVIFTYNHRDITLDAWPPDGEPGTRHFYDTYGYLWRDDVLYKVVDALDKDHAIRAMRYLKVQDNTVIPLRKGFCAGKSFFEGSYRGGESLSFAFQLPFHDAELRLKINQVDELRTPDFSMISNLDGAGKVVRNASLDLNGLKGKEYVYALYDKSTSKKDGFDLSGTWGSYAVDSDMGSVQVQLDVSIGGMHDMEGVRVVASNNNHAQDTKEFLALWDSILKTLKLRPGAF